MKAAVQAILAIAITDVLLQLDNAFAISSLASALRPSLRLVALAGGVGLGALCLVSFSLVGSAVLSRVGALKPAAGIVLILLGCQLLASFFDLRLALPWR